MRDLIKLLEAVAKVIHAIAVLINSINKEVIANQPLLFGFVG